MQFITTLSVALVVCGSAWAQTPGAATDLPVDGGQVLDNLPVLIDPQGIPEEEAVQPATGATALSVEQATKKLKLAQQKHDRWQKLARQGVISTVEVESTELEICRAELALRQACCTAAKADATTLPEKLRECEMATAAAEQALASLRLTLAERNLGRYRRLYAARLVPRVQVQRAEELVARLQAAKPVPPPVPQ